MTWLIYACISAIGSAVRDAFNSHRARSGESTPILNGWQMFAIISPALVAMVALSPLPSSPRFWLALALALPVEYLVQWTFFRALALTASSKAIPILGLTPLIVLLLGALGGEQVTPAGAGGVLLVLAGVLVVSGLGFDKKTLAALPRDRGAQLMAVCAVACSFTSLCQAQMAREGGAWATVGWYYLACIVMMLCPARAEAKRAGKPLVHLTVAEVGSSLLFLLNLVLTAAAYKLAPVAYISSAKRVSFVITVIIGRYWFKERQFRRRLAGSLLIVAGVAVIAASH